MNSYLKIIRTYLHKDEISSDRNIKIGLKWMLFIHSTFKGGLLCFVSYYIYNIFNALNNAQFDGLYGLEVGYNLGPFIQIS